MTLTKKSLADRALFQAFVNCYLREVDSGEWLPSCGENIIESDLPCIQLRLPASRLKIILEISYISIVGCHHFNHVFSCSVDSFSKNAWIEIDKFYALQLMAHELYKAYREGIDDSEKLDESKENEIELLARLADSSQVMSRFLASRAQDEALHDIDFLSTEQSNLWGHWLHPTPKSRQGMAFWVQDTYSSETKGCFKLHYFSADQSLVKQGSILDQQASEIVREDLVGGRDLGLKANHILIPIHPLQAEFLKLQPWVMALIANGLVVDVGPLGADFTPTSSVRTVTQRNAKWMFKFSIPVKITNSLRSNMRDELEDGMAVEQYLRQSGFLKNNPKFGIVDDPAYITLERPDRPNSESGFEVILRRNIFRGEAGDGVVSILSLAQDPLPDNTGVASQSLLNRVISGIAKDEGRSRKAVSLDWFVKYWHCSIETLIILYDQQGIALEAHQQNSLLDISDGYPSRYYYRDNQGFYLSKSHSENLSGINNMLTMSDIFYDDENITEAISYYVFINQLFSIIYRMGADSLISEEALLVKSRELLIAMKSKLKGVGLAFVEHILTCNKLAYKTNLLARVHDIDELHEGMERKVYATLHNPLSELLSDDCGVNVVEEDQYNVA